MDWMEAAGQIVDAIGTSRFGPALASGLRQIAPYDFTVIFGYVGAARPLDLFDDFPRDRRRLHVEEYQEGPYLLDPLFLASQNGTPAGLWRLQDIAPDRFYQGEYYRSYYAQTGLAEEIGYIVHANPKLALVISLMRKKKRFSNAEIRSLTRVWPVVRAVSRQHWKELALEARADDGEMRDRIEGAFHSVGEGILTPREREVVELTLKGHSADAIGKLLGISSGTVRIHRRNIYSKLRINSQGELFSLFLRAMIGERSASHTVALQTD